MMIATVVDTPVATMTGPMISAGLEASAAARIPITVAGISVRYSMP